MPPEVVDAESFSPDVREFLRLLQVHAVHFVIIGGEAVIFYGHIRVTGDIDVFYDPAPDNAARMYAALSDFWEGSIPQIDDPSELESPGVVFQFGVPPPTGSTSSTRSTASIFNRPGTDEPRSKWTPKADPSASAS
jgi:hypothetical protein